MLFIVMISLLKSAHADLQCEFYTKSVAADQQNAICHEGILDEQGACNTTQNCTIPDYDTTGHCFTTWSNESGVVEIVKQGCWMETFKCLNGPVCRATKAHKKGLFFCCCEGSFCNADFFYEEPDEADTEDADTQPVEHPADSDHTFLVLTCTLIPVTLFSILIVVVYWFYRARKQPFDDDVASVETPATTSTVAPHIAGNGQSELNLPQLIEMKARGRFGCVWKAQLQDKFVAVKIFTMQDKQSWQNEQEIFNTERIHEHPNVLKFIAAVSRGFGVKAELWLVTEFHSKGSLADYLKHYTVTLTEALVFMETMAKGLSFLHEDILCRKSQNGYKPAIAHRDFKSKNVLIKDDLTACIADFGLAVKFEPGESTGESHGQVGTRRYMAPEILEGAINFQRDAFLRIDMYAFALVQWEILTRCTDLPGGAMCPYLMPYECELGHSPTSEAMQEYVVEKKMRPHIQDTWRQHSVIGSICNTIEECWDHDAEARVSAGCVEERINTIIRSSTPSAFQRHQNSTDGDRTPLISAVQNTQIQNQLNRERSERYMPLKNINEHIYMPHNVDISTDVSYIPACGNANV